MAEILENNFLRIEISSSGAEPASVYSKQKGMEYLWPGDENWPRRAPVLFPIVGKLNDNSYKINGKNYSLPQHGFARDMQFELLEKYPDHITFGLQSNADTLQKYPYNFHLKITYALSGNRLKTRYEVHNLDEQEMYFSIGAHPGFNCPLYEYETLDNYYIEFEQNETLERHLLENGLFTGQTESILQAANILKLNDALFKKDAIVFKNMRSKFLYLKSDASGYSLKCEFAGFPYFGIWKKPGAPFLCLEPWSGIADNKNFDGDFSEKEGIITLPEGEMFERAFYVEI